MRPRDPGRGGLGPGSVLLADDPRREGVVARLAAGDVLFAPAHLDAEVVSAPLLERIWALRANVTAYDAAYVAFAEQLEASVVTCDQLVAADGPRCQFELIS